MARAPEPPRQESWVAGAAGFVVRSADGKQGKIGPNAETISAWDTILFDTFMRFRHLLTDSLENHGATAMDRLGV